MSEFLFELSLFGGKVAIILILLVGLMAIIGSALTEYKKTKKKKQLEIEDIGSELQNYRLKLRLHCQPLKNMKKEIKSVKKKEKQNLQKEAKNCAYILDFKGDITASQVKFLREEVSVLIKSANPKKDEIVVRLTNRGGLVSAHGLAASQLQRLRDHGFYLTVCVDEVAGSGGYLMACTANKILSTPFAIIGSIGVLAQIPNFHRLLQKQNVDFEEHSAGQFKRTLTLFGKNTEEKREKLRKQLEEIHESFKNYVIKYRPHLDLSQIATGDHWLGEKAKTLGLVDELSTSDDYILSLLENKKVLHIRLKENEPKGLMPWLSKKAQQPEQWIDTFLTLLKKIIPKK